MINRRTFSALLAGMVAAPNRAWSQQVTAKTAFYASTGPELTLFDVDVGDGALQKRSTVTLPANVQYAWPHPSKRYLYVVSSSGGPGSTNTASPSPNAHSPIREPLTGAPLTTCCSRLGRIAFTVSSMRRGETRSRPAGW